MAVSNFTSSGGACYISKNLSNGSLLEILRRFSSSREVFTANFWVWSVCPFETPKPLESLKVVNSKEVNNNYTTFSRSKNLSDTFKASKNVFWSEEEMNTILYHNWNHDEARKKK